MRCVILQPSYIPWRGYFHQIQRADVFVFLDDVQYDARGWRNRNRVKAPGASRWLTIPVHARGAQVEGTAIRDVRIDWSQDWTRRHRETLRHCYRKAPFYDRYAAWLLPFYARRDELLADFTIALTIALARELGLRTRFVRSSTLAASGAKTDRLLGILQQLGATHYLSGPSAQAYIDPQRFERAGIGLEYMTYDYPAYPQLHPPFDPQVSILDLLFMTGSEAPRYVWGA